MSYNYKNDKVGPQNKDKNCHNVDGPFYTMNHCIVCGGPGAIAPLHIKFTNEIGILSADGSYSCVVVRQPQSLEELKTMVDAMSASCVECIRYSGNDSVAINLIHESGFAHLIDERT